MLLDKREIYSVGAMLGLISLFFILALYFPASMQIQSDVSGTMLSTELELIRSYHIPPSIKSPLNYIDTSNEPPAYAVVTSVLSIMAGYGTDIKDIILLNYLFTKIIFLLVIPIFIYLIAKYLWGKSAIYSIIGAILSPVFLIGVPISNYVFITFTFIVSLFCIFTYLDKGNMKYILILALVSCFGIFTHQITWIYEVVLISFFLLFLSKGKAELIIFACYIICALSILTLFIIQIGYTTSVSGESTILRALTSLIGHIGPVLSIGIPLAIWRRDLLPINKPYSLLIVIALTFLSFGLFSQSRIHAEVIVLCAIAFAPIVGFTISNYKRGLNYAFVLLILIASISLSYHFAAQSISTHNVLTTYKDLTALGYLDETNSNRLLSNSDICLLLSSEKMVLPFIQTELDKYPELACLKKFSRANTQGQVLAKRFIDPKWTIYYNKILNIDIYIKYDKALRDEIALSLANYDLISRVVPWERIEVQKDKVPNNPALNMIYSNGGSLDVYSVNLNVGEFKSLLNKQSGCNSPSGTDTPKTRSSIGRVFQKILIDWPLAILNSHGIVGYFPILFSLVLLSIFAYKIYKPG